MNYIRITDEDLANGAGVRCVLWVAGCDVRCEGCHNPETWNFDAGRPFNDEAIEELIEIVNRPWVQGLSLSGGHPLACKNLSEVYKICKTVKERCPGKDIWLYTGYTLHASDFNNSYDNGRSLLNRVLAMCDVVVDGKYDAALRDVSLRFRGSSNQRIIDVKKTVLNKEICLWGG